jgi:deoxyadenosine/deoxycytidine kinase
MNTPTYKGKIIAVEGNLGAGKSTYLSFLSKTFNDI